MGFLDRIRGSLGSGSVDPKVQAILNSKDSITQRKVADCMNASTSLGAAQDVMKSAKYSHSKSSFWDYADVKKVNETIDAKKMDVKKWEKIFRGTRQALGLSHAQVKQLINCLNNPSHSHAGHASSSVSSSSAPPPGYGSSSSSSAPPPGYGSSSSSSSAPAVGGSAGSTGTVAGVGAVGSASGTPLAVGPASPSVGGSSSSSSALPAAPAAGGGSTGAASGLSKVPVGKSGGGTGSRLKQ